MTVGHAAEVTVTVNCRIPLSDQAVPGLPGSRQVARRWSAPSTRTARDDGVGPGLGERVRRGRRAALLAMAGLVVDGGGKVRAAQRADRIAAEAGRAAGQQIELAAAVAGERPRVDVGAAVAAAQRYIAGPGWWARSRWPPTGARSRWPSRRLRAPCSSGWSGSTS